MHLTHKEILSLTEWFALHISSCGFRHDGDITFKQSSASGIGTTTHVYCSCDHKKHDITDYGAW